MDLSYSHSPCQSFRSIFIFVTRAVSGSTFPEILQGPTGQFRSEVHRGQNKPHLLCKYGILSTVQVR